MQSHMNLYKENLTIRNAAADDAEQLCAWWNDGKVMAHAGFPNGLNETPEEIRRSLAEDSDETHRRHIIELDSEPIGEMNYRSKGGGIAEIGIKICDFSKHEQGLGTALLSMFIDALFLYYGYERIILDTNTKNVRDEKLGFKQVRTRFDSWQDQLGEWQSSIDYELHKKDWFANKHKPLYYIHIRPERPDDYYAVESLTRDAFWFWADDGSDKICDEHLLVHKLRTCPSYVPELNYVAEVGGRLAGHIIYTKSKVLDDSGTAHETLTFGPLSVLPEYQRQGVGKALMRHTLDEAKRLGYRAVIIFGHPEYYPRVGFRRAAEFGITTADGGTGDYFMVYTLYEDALNGINGRYYIDPAYETLTQDETLEFDKRFPPKER
jgi:predicted N-acetyltransferase YhbS/RimJ/RimL family protein N-acetyltransferase